jgi:riboflavin biosynthesis pyrimidine reductase
LYTETSSFSAERSRSRKSRGRDKYLEALEQRQLLSTVVGGERFLFSDARGNPVQVQLNGHVVTELNAIAPRTADGKPDTRAALSDTDRHLINEGLSRVMAQGVMAGARTATGPAFFSVWHPQLVALRNDLGLPRHPAQIVVSFDGNLDAARTLLFNVPSVPVFVIAGPKCRERCKHMLDRPGLTMIPTETRDLTVALRELRLRGIERIAVAGGRTLATSLIDAGLVQDLYLTTTLKPAGKPGTPFYAGTKQLKLDSILRKRLVGGRGEPAVKFEHLKVSAH